MDNLRCPLSLSVCLALAACGPSHYSEAPPIPPGESGWADESDGNEAPAEGDEPPAEAALRAPDIALTAADASHTLASDIDSLPEWAVRNPGRLPRHRPSVNVIRHSSDVFESLEAAAGAFHGVLVCRLEVLGDRRWDQSGRDPRPDVTLRLSLSGAQVNVRGPEDEKLFTTSVPNVRLAPGDEVEMTAIDRDVMVDDPMAQLTVRFEGLPLVAESPAVRVECRGLAQAAALQRAREHLAVFLADYGDLAPVPEDLPASERRAADARRPIGRLAAWLGWAHPTVVACVAAVDEVVATWPHQPPHRSGTGTH